MWKKLLPYLFVCCCVALLFCSVANQQETIEQTLQTTSSSIRDKLQILKQNSDGIMMLVTSLQNELNNTRALSEAKQKALEQKSTSLSNSLITINQQLNDSYMTITALEKKISIKNNILTVLIVVLVIRTVGMFIGFLFYLKGIKLPRWLDIIL